MSATIRALEDRKKYLLGHIEYLEATLEKYKANEGKLEEDFCNEQIDFCRHSLAGYRMELHQIESEIAALGG